MTYGVRLVADERLPDGQDWVMVRDGADMHLILKESKACPSLIEEAWSAVMRWWAS